MKLDNLLKLRFKQDEVRLISFGNLQKEICFYINTVKNIFPVSPKFPVFITSYAANVEDIGTL